MNKKQFSEHIGNIDEKLVWQAEQIPNYRKERHHKKIRAFTGIAAAIALMACSFSAGAFAFAREVVVEVPAKQEMAVLEDINLTMYLPNSWEGKYSVVKHEQNYIVYNKQAKKASGAKDPFDSGVLFYIVKYKGSMTPERFEKNGLDFTGYRYLFSTKDSTYILHYPGDVQWHPSNPEQEAAYQQMAAEIEDIRFVVENVLKD